MLQIESLTASHDRQAFDCGVEPLNIFLRQTARQHAERGISLTYVLVETSQPEPRPVCGFFALSLCQTKSEVFPPSEARKLPREVAAVRLGRLAVARTQQGKGFGELLLVAAMEKFLDIFRTVGGIGLFVDAKDENAKRFYEKFGFSPLPENPLQLFLSVKAIQENPPK
jgi:ribosomal protein S18 acetylase RimI-like enzyme